MECDCIAIDGSSGVDMTGGRTRQQLDAWQGAMAFIGITLGVLPLAQVLFGRGPGLLRLVLGEDPGVSGHVLPIVVVAMCVAVIAWLESIKRTS
jgi:hypothetical protein